MTLTEFKKRIKVGLILEYDLLIKYNQKTGVVKKWIVEEGNLEYFRTLTKVEYLHHNFRII